MAKIIIAGNSCTVVSAFTTEELKTLKKCNPNALVLKDKEGENGKAIFMADVGSCGSVSPAGIVFDGTTHDGKKLACLTKMIPNGACDVNEWVMEEIGTSIIKLNKLEDGLRGALDGVEADKAAVLASISTME